MSFIERGDRETLAEHLLRNAAVLGADKGQTQRLKSAFLLSVSALQADRMLGGQIAAEVRAELKVAFDALLIEARARGEKVETYNDAGAKRIKGRDGLAALALPEQELSFGLSYRQCYDVAVSGLKSSLNPDAGGGRAFVPGLGPRDQAALRRAYLLARLAQFDRAIAQCGVGDGRELLAVRLVAGEGRTINSFAIGGQARKVYTSALRDGLAVVGEALRVRPPLRITGS